MRKSTLLRKASSSQSICVFCACRLSGDTVTARAPASISYAQRRQLNGGPARPPGVPPSQLAQNERDGNATTAAFPDAASQARAALEAMNRKKDDEKKALARAADEASERRASENLFGNAPIRNQQSNATTRTSRETKSQGPRITYQSDNRQPIDRHNYDRRNNNRQESRSGVRDRPRQRNMQSSIISEAQSQKSTRSMPNLDAPRPKPEPKTQAPSWMISQPRQTPSSTVSSWTAGMTPPPTAESQIASNNAGSQSNPAEERTSFPSMPASSDSQAGVTSNIFSQVDATRQALAKTMEFQRQAPLRNAMSALKRVQANREVEGSRRESAPQPRTTPSQSEPAPSDKLSRSNESVPQSSGLNSEEEKLLAQLLARRSGTSSNEQAESVTYSPFNNLSQSARSALAQETSTISQAQQSEPTREREQGQRYRITMSNNSRPADNAQPFDPEISSNWSILGRRNQQVQQEEPSNELRSSFRTPDDIDAKFQEYRRRRPSNGVDLENIAYSTRDTPLARRPRTETRTCARCGEQGHIAANCTNAPMRRVPICHRCGVKGHVIRDCPVPAGGDAAFGNNNRRDAQSNNIPQASNAVAEGGFRIRRVNQDGTEAEIQPRMTEKVDAEEEDDDNPFPVRRDVKPRKFTEAPVEEPRTVRRGRRGEDGEIGSDRPNRSARRNRFAEDDEEIVRPSRGRRNRNDEDDDDVELSYEDFEGARERRLDRKKARQAKKHKAAKEAAKTAARQARKDEEQTQIRLPEFISVSNLAQTLGVRYENFVNKMEDLGFTSHSHDHILSAETASLIAMEYNFDPIVGDVNNAEVDERDLKARPEISDKDFLPTRPPVVAIMGHVDHGKTTILDFLRKSSVAASEHGGITQHIGAFSVGLSSGKTITFLDTPGHAAFLEMRKRGATVTDIIILVVAADDSVKPQTIEAIKHAKAANVPIIVAINKIDKEEANIDRVKQDLARHEVEIEDFGGDTQVVPVSGKTGLGIDELEDNIVTLSEILDHRAETDGPVEGWVLEATTKKAGRVATVLVRRGTLVPGNIIVAGKTWARVRTLKNEAGVNIHSAGPGTPVEVDGWKDQPNAGDEALQAPNEQKAADVVDYRLELDERTKMAEDMEAINEIRRAEAEKRERERLAAEAAAKAAKAAANAGEDGVDIAPSSSSATNTKPVKEEEELNATPGHQTVPFIIKADVSGSVEAVSAYLLQMSNPLCSPTLLRAGVGPVGEFDLEHAAAAGGHIISFNLPHAPEMIGQADKRGVRLIEENVIYRIVGDVKTVLEDKLPPLKNQRVVGEADVAMAFEIGVGGRKKLRIAGCKVRNGMIARGSRVRVLRGERKVYDGILSSLKNVKKDVQEMRKGTECGMSFDDWEEFEVGDQIQTYEEKVEKRTLQI